MNAIFSSDFTFQNINLPKQNRKIFYVTFLSVIVFISITTTVANSLLVRRILYKNSVSELSQQATFLEENIQSGISIAVQACNDYSLTHMASQSIPDYQSFLAAQTQMITYMTLNNQIASIYIYNGTQKRILSSTPIPGNHNLLISLDSLQDSDAVSFINEYSKYPIYQPIARQFVTSDNQIHNYYTILGYDPYTDISSNGNLSKAIIVNLSADEINNMVSNQSEGIVLITSQDGKIINDNPLFSIGSDLTTYSETFYEKLTTQADIPYLISNIGSVKYFIGKRLIK